MELVTEDGSVVELKEGQRHELGRGSAGAGLGTARDDSVSRLHVLVELLRPTSRKGKEVVGQSPDLKLYVQVVGRNPICIASRGAEDKTGLPRIKFASRGDKDWLDPGDKFALSIRRPLFFSLRQQRPGGHEKVESLTTARKSKAVENNLSSLPVEKDDGMEVNNSRSLEEEEEEGIAKAVARRQRRRLEREREGEQQRVCPAEQQQAHENCEQIKTSAKSQEEASVVPCQLSSAVHPFDPVSEFGFIVRGSEFQPYEKRSKTDNARKWSWKIEKKGGDEEEWSDDEAVADKSESTRRAPGKKPISLQQEEEEEEEEEEDNQEWGGDSKEEEEERIVGHEGESQVSTRSSRAKSSDQKRKSSQTLNTQLSEQTSDDDTDMTGFIVDDDESIEEEEDEEEWMDDDETVAHKTGKQSTSGKKQKPVCKYGSKCYRKNKEHLSQFSHPER